MRTKDSLGHVTWEMQRSNHNSNKTKMFNHVCPQVPHGEGADAELTVSELINCQELRQLFEEKLSAQNTCRI